MFQNLKVLILSVLMVSSALLFNGCSHQEEEITEKPIPQVEVMNLGKNPEYVISEVGTIKPIQEIEILSRASGTINNLSVALGDIVSADQVLAVIDYGDSENSAHINLETANLQLANARANLNEVQTTNQNTVENSQLVIQSLESTLERFERNLEELKQTNENTGESIDNSVTNAQVNVDSAQINYDGIVSQFEQSWDEYYEGAENALDAILVNADMYYQFASGILNPQSKAHINISDLPATLGAYNSIQKNGLVNLYNDIEDLINNTREFYSSNIPIGEDNIDNVLDQFEDFTSYMREFLDELGKLFNNSISGDSFSEAGLAGYKTTATNYQGMILGDISSINSFSQNRQSLQLSQTAQISIAGNNLTVAKNQLNDAQNNQTSFETTSGGAVKDLEFQIESTKRDIESAKTNLNSTMQNRDLQNNTQQLQIDTLENQVRLATQSFENNKITSPINGMISELYIDEGDYVNAGSLIAKAIQHKQVKVVFYVSKDIAGKLSINHPINFEVSDNGDHYFNGVISKISPSADPISKKVKIEALASNDDYYLRPEMFVNVSLNISEETFDNDKIYIPLNAVIIGQDKECVFVVENNIAVKKEIELGKIFDKWVEIKSGLSKTDQIVVEGHRNLQEGEAVQF